MIKFGLDPAGEKTQHPAVSLFSSVKETILKGGKRGKARARKIFQDRTTCRTFPLSMRPQVTSMA